MEVGQGRDQQLPVSGLDLVMELFLVLMSVLVFVSGLFLVLELFSVLMLKLVLVSWLVSV